MPSEWQPGNAGWQYHLEGVVLHTKPPANADPQLVPMSIDLKRVVAVSPVSFTNGDNGAVLWMSAKDSDYWGVRIPYPIATNLWMTACGFNKAN